MNIQPINTKKTYQQVIEQFISLIVSGQLKVGDKLPSERDLADMFQVSRASIREAFRALEIVGIIDVKPGGGTYVTDLNIAPFINTIAPLFVNTANIKSDLMDFRIMLEGETAKLAAEKRAEDGITAMEKSLLQMKKAMETKDKQNEETADINFHLAIFKATGNNIYIKAGECLSYVLSASIHSNRLKILSDSNYSMVWYKDHTAIFEAIKSGNSQEAFSRLSNHLEGVRKLL